jgi:predicted nucleic acid-binding protein
VANNEPPYVDTDVIIRLLTADDPHKQVQATSLFRQVEDGALVLTAPDTVIADAVYVLASPRLYAVPRSDVRDLLTPLVALPGFRVSNKRTVLRALEYFGARNIDFGDAMIVAAMELDGAQRLYSYDRDFDRISGVARIEP